MGSLMMVEYPGARVSLTGLEKKLLTSFFSNITSKYSNTLPRDVLTRELADDARLGRGLGDRETSSVQSLLTLRSGSGDGV